MKILKVTAQIVVALIFVIFGYVYFNDALSWKLMTRLDADYACRKLAEEFRGRQVNPLIDSVKSIGPLAKDEMIENDSSEVSDGEAIVACKGTATWTKDFAPLAKFAGDKPGSFGFAVWKKDGSVYVGGGPVVPVVARVESKLTTVDKTSNDGNVNGKNSYNSAFEFLVGHSSYDLFQNQELNSVLSKNIGGDALQGNIRFYFNYGENVIRESNFIIGAGSQSKSGNGDQGIWVYNLNDGNFFVATYDAEPPNMIFYTASGHVVARDGDKYKTDRSVPNAFIEWLKQIGISPVIVQ